jgi:DNA-binding NtrC family response regulator
MSDSPRSHVTNAHVSGELRRPRLLLVDDDPMALRALTRILETNQPYWNIACASSGEEAMALIARESFAVVITDLVMPGANGLALLYHLQQQQPNAIRIVHSSHVELLKSGSLGKLAHRVLPKPASAIDVLAVTTWARQQFSAVEPPKSTRVA